MLGSTLGPHPYPEMVANFQAVIREETLQQCHNQMQTKPDLILACVGGTGLNLGEHAARFRTLTPGVLHGCHTYVLQNGEGQIATMASISAGLDYPAVGPQHAQLHALERAQYVAVEDEQALQALRFLARTEGILCAVNFSAIGLCSRLQLLFQGL